MSKTKTYKPGEIYLAKKGCIYDPDRRRYNCYMPAILVDDARSQVLDCWVCDIDGNIHPGYNNCAVPIPRSHLGQLVGKQFR